MENMTDYIEKYGRYSFKELPFNELDALVFSQLVYIDFDLIADKTSVFLNDAVMRFYSRHTDEEIEGLIGITSKAINLMSLCAKTVRYGYVRLLNYVNSVDVDLDKQFCAICFELDDDNTLVAFRGTDVTVTGVKESAMLSYMFPVPAQIQALHYFQENTMLAKGDVYLCGHSKGGNLAVFAGVNCSNSLKKRIKGIYEFDAPGFPQWFFDRFDYKQIEDRIFFFAPEASVIGRILRHGKAPVIVKSTNEGIRQHQVSSWETEESHFITEISFNAGSDFLSDYINSLIDYVGEDDLEIFFDMIEYLVENMGIEDFYDLKGFDIRKAIRLIDSYGRLDETQKERFKLIIKKASSDFAKEFLKSKYKAYFPNRLK